MSVNGVRQKIATRWKIAGVGGREERRRVATEQERIGMAKAILHSWRDADLQRDAGSHLVRLRGRSCCMVKEYEGNGCRSEGGIAPRLGRSLAFIRLQRVERSIAWQWYSSLSRMWWRANG